MRAGRYDRLEIEQGATFELDLQFDRDGVAWDFTGATLRAKIRETFDDASALATMDVQIVSATAGEVRLYMAASATAALPTGDLPTGFLPIVWDLEVLESPTASGVVRRLLEGRGKIFPEATK